jgi:multiple sugar transport system substrate-binding protein
VHTYHISPSVAAIEAQPGVDLFAANQAAMRGPTGPWMLTGYSENPDLSYTTVPMPSGEAGQKSVICWSGFAVNEQSENAEAAYKLVKYIATKGQEILVDHGMTADVALAESTGRENDPLWASFMNEVPNLQPLDDLKTAYWVECVNTPLSKLLESIQGPDGAGVDIQAELDAMATEADTCLAQPF